MISRLAPVLLGWLAVAGAAAAATNNLAEAKTRGQALAQQLQDQFRPATNYTQTGTLKIYPEKGKRLEFPLRCEVVITPTNWQSIYETVVTNGGGFTNGNRLKVVHAGNQPGEYTSGSDPAAIRWSGTGWVHPFSGSDFWAVDLGLEFLHWPGQKLLRHEFRRTRGCNVLESMNPGPATNGYSRVLTWIDTEGGGIVLAEAYDADGKLLKEFYPKDLKKVDGQWQLETMDISNVQTKSHTRLDFDLKRD